MAGVRLYQGILQGKLRSIMYGWSQALPGHSSGYAKGVSSMAAVRLHKGFLRGKLRSIKYGWSQAQPGHSSG
jgi:hypothetical protein